jgi:hypothetical protein
VAKIIALLASDAGRSYHGACINIKRGITAGWRVWPPWV